MDILEKLRREKVLADGSLHPSSDIPADGDLLGKAADEIERLRKIEESYLNMMDEAEDRRWM